jgi:hypothetical protein
MDSREHALLELKRRAGLATADEIQILDRALVHIGDNGDLVAHQPAKSIEEWIANYNAGVYGPTEHALVSAGFTLGGTPPPDFASRSRSDPLTQDDLR